MSVEPPQTPPSKGGGAFSKKIGGIPAWAVYVGGGLAVGIIYVVLKGRKAKDTTGTTTASTTGTTPAAGTPAGPDIIPINQGLTDNQVGDLVAAITSLQGRQSKPPKTPSDKGWMQQEAEALAAMTGESVAQIIWELQGKDPGSGPDPGGEDKPLPSDNLYGSWAGLDLGSWADQYTGSGGDSSGSQDGDRGGHGQDHQGGGGGRGWQDGQHADGGQGNWSGDGGNGQGGYSGGRSGGRRGGRGGSQ